MSFINNIFSSLETASVYALLALVFTLGANINGLINFVTGQLFMITIFVISCLCDFNLSFLISALLAVVISIAFNMLIYLGVYKFIQQRSQVVNLIVSIGLSFLIQNVFVFIFSADPKNLTNVVTGYCKIGSLSVDYIELIAVFIALVAMFLVYQLSKRTKFGKMIRAVSENSEATALMGIDNDKIICIVYGICGFLTALASILFYMSSPIVDPYVGTMIGLRALCGAMIGGLGIVPGSEPEAIPRAIIGGFVIGLIETLVKSYISIQAADIFIFFILAVYLFVNNKKYHVRYK